MAVGGGIRQAIGIDGKDQVVAGFNEIGAAGEKSFNKINRSSESTTQSLREFTRELGGARRALSLFSGVGGQVSGSLVRIGGLLGGLGGGFIGAFAGTAIGAAISGLLGSLDKIAEKLAKLQQQGREAGVAPLAIQAIGEAARKAGLDADVGTQSLTNFSKALDEQRKKGGTQIGPAGVQVLRGGADVKSTSEELVTLKDGVAQVTTVLRGGTKATKDWSDSLGALGISFKNFPDTPKGKLDAYSAAIQRALALEAKFPSQINRLSQELFGQPIANIRDIAGDATKLDALIKQLAGTARAANEGALSDAQKLKAAQGEVGTAWEELTAGYQKGLLGVQTASNKWLAGFLSETLPGWGTGVSQFFADLLPNLQQQLSESWTATMALFKGIDDQMFAELLAGWISFWESVESLASGALDWVSQKATQVIDAIKSALSSVGSALGSALGAGGAALPQFAGGGVVRGPGSGTSDSILARLSDGEFVMRSAAVRHWGAGLLASMNAAAGGLSMPLLPSRSGRFADGGLVAAGGGTGRAVHLHLGGHEFALSGAGGVVDALVSHARQQQMRSSGVKPSWYGGRANT